MKKAVFISTIFAALLFCCATSTVQAEFPQGKAKAAPGIVGKWHVVDWKTDEKIDPYREKVMLMGLHNENRIYEFSADGNLTISTAMGIRDVRKYHIDGTHITNTNSAGMPERMEIIKVTDKELNLRLTDQKTNVIFEKV